MEGKIDAALKFLEMETSKGILSLTDDILEELKEEHPLAATIQEDSLLDGPIDYIPPSILTPLMRTQCTKRLKTPKKLQAHLVWLRNCIAEYFGKAISGTK